MRPVIQSPYVFAAAGSKKEPDQYAEVFYFTHLFEHPRRMERKILDLETDLTQETWAEGSQFTKRLEDVTLNHEPLGREARLFEALSEAFGQDTRIIIKENSDAYSLLVTKPKTSDEAFRYANGRLGELLEQESFHDWSIIKKLPFHTLRQGGGEQVYFITNPDEMKGMKPSSLDERLEDSAFHKPSTVKKILDAHDDDEAAWAAMSLMTRSRMGRFYRAVSEGDVLEIKDLEKVRKYKINREEKLDKLFDNGVMVYEPEKIPKTIKSSLPTILNQLVRDQAVEIVQA